MIPNPDENKIKLEIVQGEPVKEERRKLNRDHIRRLMRGYAILIGIPEEFYKGWAAVNFARFSKPLSEILITFNNDWELAWECIEFVYRDITKKPGFQCTLNTIANRTDIFLEELARRKK